MALVLMRQQQEIRSSLLVGSPSFDSCSTIVNSRRGDRGLQSLNRRLCKGPKGHRVSASAAPASAAEKPKVHHKEKPAYAEGECIEVEESFEASEGAQLTPELKLGKHLGSGSTADVYKLTSTGSRGQDGHSKTAGQVLKWAKPLPGMRRAFQREWMLGRRLNAAAQEDPTLSLMLQTGPAVVTSCEGKKGHDDMLFRGAVLEAVKGQSLDKRLEEDASFCDIDFILACLQTVLTALDRAHKLVGFEHGDLRVSNIMEHLHDPDAYEHLLQYPETWRNKGYESAASAALDQGILSFKLLDWGHSEIHESKSRQLLLSAQRSDAADSNQYVSSTSSGPNPSGKKGASSDPSGSSSLALKRLPPAKGFIEAIYTFWYKDKSDAWRLMHSLAPRLDGRAWPERKRQLVLNFYELMEELQDIKLEAKFFQDTEFGPDGQARRLGSSELVKDESAGGFVKVAEVPALDVTAKPRRFKVLRRLRDVVLRAWSRLFSRKKRVSAREVLKKMRQRGLLVLPEKKA